MNTNNNMNTNHVLYFSWNRAVEGRHTHAFENFTAMNTYWNKRKAAGDIANVEVVMLSATGNEHMPVGFCLITGERTKLQQIRWDDQEFLNLHTTALMTLEGYACVEGIYGEAVEKQLNRFATLNKNLK